jgi:hypothetical protein
MAKTLSEARRRPLPRSVRGALALLGLLLAAGVVLRGAQDLARAAALTIHLSGLVGRTGLDPLDPVQPLDRVEVLETLRSDARRGGPDEARVRFAYADGSARTYLLRVSHPEGLLGGWRYTGADRAFAPHRALTSLPFAGSDAPLRLGRPTRLAAAAALPGAGTAAISTVDLPGPGPAWSPGGDAVLLRLWDDAPAAGPVLWVLPTAGGPPERLAAGVHDARWTADGTGVVYTAWEAGRAELRRVDRAGRSGWRVVLDGPPVPPVATVAGAVLFARGGALWRVRDGAGPAPAPERVRDLPGLHDLGSAGEPPAFAVDAASEAVAYACGPDLCLSDRDGAVHRVALGGFGPAVPPLPELPPFTPAPRPALASSKPGVEPEARSWPELRPAWSPDGGLVAVASVLRPAGPEALRPRLSLVSRDGRLLGQADVGPNGWLDAPFWTPDGAHLLVRAYPERGRRLVAVEVGTGRLADLSQPGWDALFTPAPDGTRLLATNGRGGYWLVPLERRPATPSTVAAEWPLAPVRTPPAPPPRTRL